ncbi:MAG: hypothetical protein H6651_11990 [Ardenticatenales bacterium]|nr:hypothetical protein [Ardenticatenales bacterium]
MVEKLIQAVIRSLAGILAGLLGGVLFILAIGPFYHIVIHLLLSAFLGGSCAWSWGRRCRAAPAWSGARRMGWSGGSWAI